MAMEDIDYTKINRLAERIWLWRKTQREDDILREALEVAAQQYVPILKTKLKNRGLQSIVTRKFSIRVYKDGGISVKRVEEKE